jgi:hypothetical protein
MNFSIHLQVENSIAVNIPGVVAAESVLEAMGLASPLGVTVGGNWPITFWRTSLIFNCKLDLFGKMSTCAAWEQKHVIKTSYHFVGGLKRGITCWLRETDRRCLKEHTHFVHKVTFFSHLGRSHRNNSELTDILLITLLK